MHTGIDARFVKATLLLLSIVSAMVAQSAQATSPPFPENPPPILEAQPAPADKFNAVIFEEIIHQQFAGNVMGYSFVVANQDGIAAKVSGGYAQAPGDGDVAMKTHRASNLGSVSKVLSGVALLYLFEQQALFNGTVAEQLDTPFWDRLPPKWQTAYAGGNLEEITYRQLLQHKSGFRIGDGKATAETQNDGDGVKMSYVISRGVQVENINVRDYNNFNFALLIYLIPALAYPDEIEAIHNLYADLDIGYYSEAVSPGYGVLYERFMHDVLFPLALEPIAPTCRPSQDLPANGYAKWYSNINDATGALIEANYCRAQGTWSLTAEDLSVFARTFLHTSQILSLSTRTALFDPNATYARLIWNRTPGHAGFDEELGQEEWPAHGGSHDGYRAGLIQLPYGYVGVGMINSGGFDSGAVIRAMLDAFHDATRGEPIALAKHGIKPSQYQRYTSELADHGSMVDWMDFYEQGGEVYVNVIFRPANVGWRARHNLTSGEYQSEYDQYVKNGPYKLKQIDSYVNEKGQLRYAMLMVKGDNSGMPAYHGRSLAEHKAKFDQWTEAGYVPVNIVGSSVNGQTTYAAFYEKKEVGGLWVKSFLPASDLDEVLADQQAAGRALAHINSYTHDCPVCEQLGVLDGGIRYSVIFYGNLNVEQKIDHHMSGDEYQSAFDMWTGQGYGLHMVTGAGAEGAHWYAALWEKSLPLLASPLFDFAPDLSRLSAETPAADLERELVICPVCEQLGVLDEEESVLRRAPGQPVDDPEKEPETGPEKDIQGDSPGKTPGPEPEEPGRELETGAQEETRRGVYLPFVATYK